MKKIFLIIPLLFLGCVNQSNISVEKQLKQQQIEKKLIDKYQISKDALINVEDGYIFTLPTNDGIAIYKLDKNYDLVRKKTFPILLDVKKVKYINGKIYIVGYDQNKNRPALLITDKELNSYTLKHFSNSFDIPEDFIVENGKLVVLLNTFKNHNPDIEIYENGKNIVFNNPQTAEHGKFIIKQNGGYLIIGSIQHPHEDLLILFAKDGKIIWSRVYDFGLDDSPVKVKKTDKNIQIDIVSQDYMGAQSEFYITIDKNGNIIKVKKGVEFKTLPMRLRT